MSRIQHSNIRDKFWTLNISEARIYIGLTSPLRTYSEDTEYKGERERERERERFEWLDKLTTSNSFPVNQTLSVTSDPKCKDWDMAINQFVKY